MAKKYYSVRKGYRPGIYSTWSEAQKQVSGFSNAEFQSFTSKKEAEQFLNNNAENSDQINKQTVSSYVDGSFDKANKKYSYGVVIIQDGKVLDTINNADNDPKYAESFQIAGECFGCLNAIKWAKKNGYKKIIIHYDYMGIEMWAKGKWRAKKTVSKDYVKYYNKLSQGITVEFVKVKAHSGIKYNEMADQLAKKALKQ